MLQASALWLKIPPQLVYNEKVGKGFNRSQNVIYQVHLPILVPVYFCGWYPSSWDFPCVLVSTCVFINYVLIETMLSMYLCKLYYSSPNGFQLLHWVLKSYFSVHNSLLRKFIWDKVFKNWPSKICGRQPLKNLKWYSLLRQTISLKIFYRLSSTNFNWSIHSWILCPI